MKHLSFPISCLISISISLPCCAQTALTDPYQSESVVVARYLGYNHKDKISYKTPPVATYRVCVFLQGPPCGANGLRVKYSFGDDTVATLQSRWTFKPSMMPKKNSLWILFIPNVVPLPGGVTETFRGALGRMAFTKETAQSVLKQIENNGQKSAWYKSLDMGDVLHELDAPNWKFNRYRTVCCLIVKETSRLKRTLYVCEPYD